MIAHSLAPCRCLLQYTYFQTSSSVVGADPWTDAGWCWHPLYNMKCGLPTANASQSAPGVWSREFANCQVSLNQQKATYVIRYHGEVVSSSSSKSSVAPKLPATVALKLDDESVAGLPDECCSGREPQLYKVGSSGYRA